MWQSCYFVGWLYNVIEWGLVWAVGWYGDDDGDGLLMLMLMLMVWAWVVSLAGTFWSETDDERAKVVR